MISKEFKNKYIELIEEISLSDPVVTSLKMFIEGYDGSNETQFHELVVSMIKFLVEYKQTLIKAEGYDALVKSKAEFEERLRDITAEFEEIENGQAPVVAAAGSLD